MRLPLHLLDINVQFDVNQAIKDAETALGKYGPAIYAAARHQVAAQMAIALFWSLFGLVVFLVCTTLFVIATRRSNWSEGDRWSVISIASAITAGIFFFVMAVNLPTFVTLWMAPDWAALQLLKP